MTKAELRLRYRTLRKALSEEQIEDYSLQIANQLLLLPIWNYEFYHLYLSIIELKEVNTDYILNILSGKDKHIIISKSDLTSRELSHVLLTDSLTIKKNKWNIPEPVNGIPIASKQIDVVFVPLLAYDKKGHRVGYGKGFYDKFLANCKPETVKIGLSFFEVDIEISDIFNDDIRLDYCVTPITIHKF